MPRRRASPAPPPAPAAARGSAGSPNPVGSTVSAGSHRTRGREERRLRIIGGQWRGRKFRFPALSLRPTPDRVRETLFNWLQGRIVGAHCLDLYAGSGALGLEALSRGAASVTFVEQQRGAADALERLLRDWQAGGWIVACAQARTFLAARGSVYAAARAGHTGGAALTTGAGLTAAAGVGGGAGPFDLVFLDPPFGSGELPAALAALEQGWLAPGGRIYVEHARGEPLPALPAQWQELRAGTAGEVGYHLLVAAAGTTSE
ncbi:MAG TPA: RsmD family RNA methyltransferase [Steroidobacteraceae bacterium]|jgi:16S rRNA (guanine966-N2)-methyltransferase|nr:RsmD family RNA methyltransferase [Steroidobacteraceae bacterium]